jgi:hypothetical protein
MLFLVSCGVCKKTPQVIIRDSVHVEYRDRIVRDTAKVEIPVIVERNVTRDTASHLENRIVVSDAIVSNGFLYHSLETKPQTIKVPVDIHVTDTLIVEKTGETIYQTEYIEKELNWWQKFRLKCFWVLLATTAGCLVYIFRKPIMALIKTIL